MRCLVCNSTDKWINVDEHRIKPAGMCICGKCSFVSYPSKWKTKEEILAYYRKDYRNPPSSGNFYAGQRKVHFHSAFLNSVFSDWMGKKKDRPKIFEVGAAYGLALSFMKELFPQGDISGSELTLSFRRIAYHEFGLDLKEDFDESKKYDLIMSYKVLEHQLDADQELARYYSALETDGLLYISVPIWFNSMNNFGAAGFDLEYYYDPNHINVWQRSHFEFLLKRAGFEIVKEDHVMYDSTYLCKKVAPKPEMVYAVPPDETIEKMKKIKAAFIAFKEGAIEEAIKLYPDFPLAYINKLEGMRKECHEKGWEWTKENPLAQAFKNCPESTEPYHLAADFATRFGQFEEAINYAKESLKRRPNNPQAISQLINCFRELGIRAKDQESRAHLFGEARKLSQFLGAVSAQHAREAIDFSYAYAAEIPMPNEK